MMNEVKLSARAKQQIDGLEATNERQLAAGLELEARTKQLEALAQRKENMLRRYQDLLTEIQTERLAIETEYQRIRGTTVAHS